MSGRDFETLKSQLEAIGQQQVLRFYDQLSTQAQGHLLEQIADLDFEQIPNWVENYVKKDSPASIPDNFEPAPAYDPYNPDPEQKQKLEDAHAKGIEILKQGQVAAFMVAGGQGTRLGYDGPKGSYKISPIKDKPLFQVFAEKIQAAQNKFGVVIPWYIMTSELNYDATVSFFEKNGFFNLKKQDVIFFKQGTLPNFDFEGKIFLADQDTIAKSPDGHGGSLKALYKSGAIEDMANRGIEYISYFQVDNPLINIVDPLFIGIHAVDGSEMSSKALTKAEPFEKVGNFCMVGDRVHVIEYSDLPDEYAAQKDDDGSLLFELGSIAIHMISRSFVEKLNEKGFALPIHRAVKKIPHINEKGDPVKPGKPCGVKLETFVFDALPMAQKSIILKTLREQEFAPVKNATGVDSAEVTRRMMNERDAIWLESAGVNVPRKPDDTLDCELEISPLFALYPEDIQDKLSQIPEIKPGDTVYLE